ncbi:uncharacterized protein LOC118750082 [Rhagoletis pomonella]|uniref:uncharacterized protein LOC118750082 n=1 Tax=Rhagoletis pomonella TaxID=28610 RepID=UPI00177BD21D|nr:uncharacterized protein LOC118750082 [Rhagoletis pomonella]
MWDTGLSWDSPLPDDLCNEWLKYRSKLEGLNKIRIDRWMGMIQRVQTTLHSFCDASSQAYAAVPYTKTVDVGDVAHISLLTARTKVAPLKGATIPRLELSAALLLAETIQNVRDSLGLMDAPYYLWSDSAIALCWLKKHPTTLKPFISNRVRRIQELTSPDRWYHVRSARNPADCSSRGITPEVLLVHPLWWHGPGVLGSAPSNQPEIPLSQTESDELLAERRSICQSMVLLAQPLNTGRPDGHIMLLTTRFSSIQRLLGTVAIMRRRRHLRQPVVSAQELDDALYTLIRQEQGEHFAADIRQLKSSSGLSSGTKILSLNPLLDENHILRVEGRIHKAELEHDQRFPIILPKSTPFVQPLIRHAHEASYMEERSSCYIPSVAGFGS